MASVRRINNGNWQTRWRDHDKRACKKTFRLKRDADQFKTFIEHALLSHTYVDPAAAKVTFRVFAEQWRNDQHHHRQGTRDQIEGNLRLHVYPAIGDRPIGKVRARDIKDMVEGWGRSDSKNRALAPSTAGTILTWTATIFKAAVEGRIITESPCKNVRLPEIQRRRITPLSPKTVMDLEAGVQDRFKAIIMLGAGTGVRVSEALGLTLDRLDFLGKTVTIDRQLLRGSGDVPRLGPVKDRKNRPRVIPLPEAVIDSLAVHLAQFPIGSSGLVFTNATGSPIGRTSFSEMFRSVADPLGISKGEGFHQLRHFYASALIRSGESVKVVQERLGHASVLTTLEQYGHLWPDNHETTRAAMDGIFALGNAPESRPILEALA